MIIPTRLFLVQEDGRLGSKGVPGVSGQRAYSVSGAQVGCYALERLAGRNQKAREGCLAGPGKTECKRSEGLAETLELSLARSSCKQNEGLRELRGPVTRGRRADAYLQARH